MVSAVPNDTIIGGFSLGPGVLAWEECREFGESRLQKKAL
jgi:hypothetical protein